MIALTEEQRDLINNVRSVAQASFADRALEWNGSVPWENVRRLAEEDLFGVNIDPEYGGRGLGELEAMLLIETVGEYCPTTADFAYKQLMVGPRSIDMFGSEAAKEEYLPPVTRGKDSIAIAISEPDAGSDVGSMETHVTDDGDSLILNGEKIWVGNVKDSSAAVVWTKFSDGLGSVIVDLDDAGVGVENHYTNMAGFTQSHITFSDVEVPHQNVLTRGKDGFKQQLKALNWERLGCAAYATAIARCALSHGLNFAQEREQFGQPIAEFQGNEWKLADMVKQFEAARALSYMPAQQAARRETTPGRTETSIAKLYTAEAVQSIVSESLQLYGARGYQQGNMLEYLYRMARGRRIAAGTDEIQKNTIASAVKENGLPSIKDVN